MSLTVILPGKYCEKFALFAETEQSGHNYLLTGVNSLPLRQYLVPGSCALLVPCTFVNRRVTI